MMNMQHDSNQINSTGLMKRFARTMRGPAAVLRAVAGVPAGVAQNRRGTFMVVVIGTLALLAVIAIAHFAVSQSDRRASASLARASKVDEVPDQFAKHFQKVIVDDLFVNVPEEVSDLLSGSAADRERFIARREAVDRPSTDWRVTSDAFRYTIPSGGLQMPNRQFFTPEGVGSDPWLADIAPQWLNWAGDAPAGGNANEFLYRRDWGKISNFAPDGRFISLVNLRNNFAAESGFGIDANGNPRTSDGLSLLNWSPANVAAPATRILATDFGTPAASGSAASRRPAVWDSRQRGAFRAAKEWSTLLPSDIGYADNEWADTDGDGFLDARWAELVDARPLEDANGNRITKNTPQTDGKLRWVYAARAIDLSGLINVNTATDLRYEPGMAFPIGLTPADIDLRRLLTMNDAYTEWGPLAEGYRSILQPAGPINASKASNYRAYSRINAFDMGIGAYDSIRWSIKSVLVQDRYANNAWDWAGAGYASDQGGLRHAFWRQGASSATGASFDAASSTITLPAFFPTTDLGDLLARFGVNNQDETSRLEAATDGRVPGGGGGGGGVGIPRAQFSLGPLRSNRDEAVEINRTGRTNPQGVLSDSGQTTPEAMLMSAVDLRSRLTTFSASRQIPSMLGNEKLGAYSTWPTQIIADQDGKLQLGSASISTLAVSGGDLFKAYVRALAPAIKLPGVWPSGGVLPAGGPDFLARKTLFYGHQGPELALLVAGTMATNAQTMFATSGVLTQPNTLVFDADLAQTTIWTPRNSPRTNAGVPLLPWLKQGSTGYCLDPNDNNPNDQRILATTVAGKQLQTPALHLYGFEPQAFITEVGCYTVWRDTPPSGGGDNDRRPVLPGQPPIGWLTIDGDMVQSNADYLFRCVAFQLHNPFDEDVTVSSTPDLANQTSTTVNTANRFHYVKIKKFDQTGTATANAALFNTTIENENTLRRTGITLQPGETVVCYMFGETPNRVAKRLVDTNVVADFDAGKRYIINWADKQFSSTGNIDQVSRRAIMVVQADDSITRIDDRVAGSELIDDQNGTNGMTVQLWKARRADMTDAGGPNEIGIGNPPIAANVTSNDQLVDRFRLPPNTTTLDARIKAGNNEVFGCIGGDHAGPFGPLNHNGGVTIMRWATATRPSDPKDGVGSTVPLGGVPAYLLEPKRWSGTVWHKISSENSGESPNSTLEVTKAVIDRLADNGNNEADFITSNWVSGSTSNAYSSSIIKSPLNKPIVAAPVIPANLDGTAYTLLRDLLPQSSRGNKGFGNLTPASTFGAALPGSPGKAPTLRAADLLLPMAICPWQSPLRPDPTFSEQTDENIRHLTASEAFAVAYGYETLPTPSADPTKADPLSLFRKAPPAANSADGLGDATDRPVIVRGHVVLDDFAPFYDGNRNGMFDRASAYNGLNPANAATSDIRFGLGIPAALGILDQVSAFEDHQGSAIRPVSGLININTAPANVIRMLPLVTPADNTGLTPALIWNNTWPQTERNIDLGASIMAYRDKNIALKLPGREPGNPAALFNGDQAANRPLVGPQAAAATVSTERQVGRALASQIDGIREEPGFLSIGELMCVLQRRADDRGGTGTTRNNKRSLDALGFNNQMRSAAGDNNDRKGINTLLFKNLAGQLDADAVRNDFAERLQVMGALSNVTTVRSDAFAVWFVLRGYAQEDTQNLGPDDPMTPSVERRFLMVIDRSGVTDLRGANKPRIVLFKEVPM